MLRWMPMLVPTFRSSYPTSAPHFHELRKVMGTSKLMTSSAAFHLKFLNGVNRLWCRNFKWAALAVAMFAFGPAFAADMPEAGYGKVPRYVITAPVAEESDLLFTPSEAFPRVHLPPYTPVLLGSSTLPGYYGSNHSYDYQGPYYGGPNINYRFQLPYACGVLGYC
jgi:hypothetical protein